METIQNKGLIWKLELFVSDFLLQPLDLLLVWIYKLDSHLAQ